MSEDLLGAMAVCAAILGNQPGLCVFDHIFGLSPAVGACICP